MNRIISLYKIKILTPFGLFHLLRGLCREGKTMNVLLYFCAKMYPHHTALVQGERRIDYRQFYQKSLHLASHITSEYQIRHGSRVAFMARNSIEATITLFALSRAGCHIYLLNPEMSEMQFHALCSKKKFDFIIYEKAQTQSVRKIFAIENSLLLDGEHEKHITNLLNKPSKYTIGKRKSGNIIVLTGGTTGTFKSADRKQSVFDFLNPLVALIEKVQLHTFNSVYIPTPIYHGFGLSSLIVSVLLGAETHLTKGFDAKKGCCLIKKNNIDVLVLVPTMLRRLLDADGDSLKCVRRILSGGAPLNPGLIMETSKQIGSVLYNLYGTSEAGFCILATPNDLIIYPETIGKAIKGAKIRINSEIDNAIGMLEVKSSWVMQSSKNRWIATGDLATINTSGMIFLKGRSDSMIVSGGENVYPKEVEDILSHHDKIESVVIIGVPDKDFGRRLKAFITLKPHCHASETEIKQWLKSKVARYQMPASFDFLEQMPLTPIGKVDIRQLAKQ